MDLGPAVVGRQAVAGEAAGLLRLHHADHAVAGQGVEHHGEIARLEDVERQLAARQQQHARQRKDRQRLGQLLEARARRDCRSGMRSRSMCGRSWRRRAGTQENRMVDSRLRPSTASGSEKPSASKNFRSCWRAASSFQLRSALIMASSSSIASWRWLLAQ